MPNDENSSLATVSHLIQFAVFFLPPVSLQGPFLWSDSMCLGNLMPCWKLLRVTLDYLLEQEACLHHDEASRCLLKIPHHINESIMLLACQSPLGSHDLVLAKLQFSKSFPLFSGMNSSSQAEAQCSCSS